jgi:hypothetical protein
MTTNDESEGGWDTLAEEFGLEPKQSAPKAESAPARSGRLPAPSRPARNPQPEPEQERDDFGSGVVDEPGPTRAAIYDPGPDSVADEDDFGEAPEPLEEEEDAEAADDTEADEGEPTTEGDPEGQPGGKRKRRRRRRRKKGGGSPEGPGDEQSSPEGEADEEVVEEGEAPGEVEDDDEGDGPASAVDEEMDAEAVQPRPEWKVMTWNELVSKLYRPG